MIVQPDFPEHWKTRLLVKISKDESSPLAVIRLWAHCQHSRRSEFPDMTPAQLASICHWGARKPACHVALAKAGFVDKLTPKGFAAHQWSEHNAQLLQKWQAGQKGGRPPASEKPNEMPLFEKPTDNRPLTGTKPDRPDQIDQTRPEEIDKTRPDQTRVAASPTSTLLAELRQSVDEPGGMDGDSKALVLDGGKDGRTELDGLASSIAKQLTPRCGVPTLQEVRTFLLNCFAGAVDYAEPFFNTMEKQHWRDKSRKQITNWQAMAKSYASNAWRKRNQ
jgi:hypothetical protein